ncbi:hypothetical protein ACWGJW_02630 [Streptomyces nigrescens]
MIGEYARVTPAELDRALGDPEWALKLVSGRMEAEAAQCPEPALPRGGGRGGRHAHVARIAADGPGGSARKARRDRPHTPS